MGTDWRIELDTQEGAVYSRYAMLYRKCPEDYEIAAVMSIPLVFIQAFSGPILAVAFGEKSVDEAYLEIQNMQPENENIGFFTNM